MRKEKTIETKIRSDEVTKDAITYKYALVMRESARVASFRLPLYSISVEMRRDGEVISAKSVRRLISEGRLNEAISLVPVSCRAVFSMIIRSKYGN